MRDKKTYTEEYLKPSFEEYQVIYRRKKILDILEKIKPESILEIGCGMEPIFKYLDTSKYKRILTVEPSKEFYENAEKISRGKVNVRCVNAFFEEYAGKIQGEFDFILCSGLLCELEDPKVMLEAIKSVCKNNRTLEHGTVVHINVPNANSIHRLLASKMGLIHDIYQMSERNKKLQQHSVYDMESFCKIVKSVFGDSIIERGSYFLKFFSHSQMMDMLHKRIITEETLDGMYKLTEVFPEYGSEIYVNLKI